MQPLQLSDLKEGLSLQKYFQTAICFGSPRDVVACAVEVPWFPKVSKAYTKQLILFHLVFDIQKLFIKDYNIWKDGKKRPFCANEMSSNVMFYSFLLMGQCPAPFFCLPIAMQVGLKP